LAQVTHKSHIFQNHKKRHRVIKNGTHTDWAEVRNGSRWRTPTPHRSPPGSREPITIPPSSMRRARPSIPFTVCARRRWWTVRPGGISTRNVLFVSSDVLTARVIASPSTRNWLCVRIIIWRIISLTTWKPMVAASTSGGNNPLRLSSPIQQPSKVVTAVDKMRCLDALFYKCRVRTYQTVNQ